MVEEKNAPQCKKDEARDGLGRTFGSRDVEGGPSLPPTETCFFCPLPAGKAQDFSGQKLVVGPEIQRGCAVATPPGAHCEPLRATERPLKWLPACQPPCAVSVALPQKSSVLEGLDGLLNS